MSRGRFRGALGLAAFAFGVLEACAARQISSPESAAQGGAYARHTDRPATTTRTSLGVAAALHCPTGSFVGDEEAACSVAIVAPNIAVTAAHCMAYCVGAKQLRESRTRKVAEGVRIAVGPDTKIGVEKVVGLDFLRDWIVLKLASASAPYCASQGDQPLNYQVEDDAKQRTEGHVLQFRSCGWPAIGGSVCSCGQSGDSSSHSTTILSFQDGTSGAPIFALSEEKDVELLGIHVGATSGVSGECSEQTCGHSAGCPYGEMAAAHLFWKRVKDNANGDGCSEVPDA